MTTYTYSEARQNFASLLEKAKEEGEILIKRKDGSYFVVRPLVTKKSSLDVGGVDIDISSDEIVDIIREVRQRT
ncbi:MAG: type II toxin-antitoxin system Phd/YefM family antitoxin [Calditrichaceae bacterium]|nr:type II toxin-antitoxin system Phd/YefM family antitoxin [Calditrichaceae bacterium]MBN2707967.1 type II toxin-antitoxin system Phd/YefM family antitoxin [Calditrichaceae bacterium]RQV95932.1 MAG: type II toxin-antitoxin system Phd/YefM family antitoxin [Calditrichota bacterium]